MKLLCLLLLIASTSLRASECVSYGNTTLQGILSKESFTHGKEVESSYFVTPAEALCVNGGNLGPAAKGIEKLQIEINRKGGWPLMEPLLGGLVSCRGELFHALRDGYPSPRWHDHFHSTVVLRGMCHAAQPTVAGHPAHTPATYELRLIHIFEGKEPEHIFVIGESGFRSVASLQAFLGTLPVGTEVRWAPGCSRSDKEPLLSSEKDMKAFRAFLKQKGIKFILVPSG